MIHKEHVDVYITSYDYLRNDIEEYKDIMFDTVILDEAQNIKNQKTKNAECVKQLQAAHRFALSGTPIENALSELWSIFDFLMPVIYLVMHTLENIMKYQLYPSRMKRQIRH